MYKFYFLYYKKIIDIYIFDKLMNLCYEIFYMCKYHVCIFLSHFPITNLIEDEIYKEFLYFHKKG